MTERSGRGLGRKGSRDTHPPTSEFRVEAERAHGQFRAGPQAIGPLLLGIIIAGGAAALLGSVRTASTLIGPQAAGAVREEAAARGIAGSLGTTFATVALDGAEVAPGKRLGVDVVVSNEGPNPIVVAVDECGAGATMVAEANIPVQASGMSWDGVRGLFKDYVFAKGLGVGGISASAKASVVANAKECLDRPDGAKVEAGGSEHFELIWQAEVVPGIAVTEGDIPYTVTVVFDPDGGDRSSGRDPFAGPPRAYQQIVMNGSLRVSAGGREIVSAGRAVDALLADERFIDWLAEEPTSTWSTANIFLQSNPSGEGIAPKSASWEIDIFRENKTPRTWAIGFVDSYDGRLISLSICDTPCDR